MKSLILFLALLVLPVTFAVPPPPPPRPTSTPLPYPNTTEAINSGLTFKILSQQAAANARAKLAARGPNAKCNSKNVSVRKEWRTISAHDRKQYVKALYCLYGKPNTFNTTLAPGAKNYWDSFTATHIREGNFVHDSAKFLTFHRYFTFLWDQALRDCGYTGPTPYWEWGLDVASPRDSPIFDGSETSLGSDGTFIPSRNDTVLGPGVSIPPGTGGGCVYGGPFSQGWKGTNYTVNLGPGGNFNVPLIPAYFRYNPRCLKRDLNPLTAQKYLTYNWTTATITQPQTVEIFQAMLQGDPRYPPPVRHDFGIHGAGHQTIGLEGGNFWTSPVDPAFFLHHGQVDRVYTIWQNTGPASREKTIFGTLTIVNNPPSRNATLDDLQMVEPVGKNLPIKDLLSTIDGPFCYIYE